MGMKAMTVKMQQCDDGDDTQASNDPSGDDDRCPSASCPSGSLPGGDFFASYDVYIC
jgi:hypothetical protein